MFSAKPRTVKYEAIIDIDSSCKVKIIEVAEQHLKQHLQIDEQNWDHQKTFKEFSANLPLTSFPLLPETDAESKEPRVIENFIDKKGEREAKHIVIFIGGNPDWTDFLDSVRSFVTNEAEKSGIALTSKTAF